MTYGSYKHPAVVVGLCAHGLEIVRNLGRAGIPVIALESNTSLPGVYTKFADVRFVPNINNGEIIDSLIEVSKTIPSPQKPVLFLTNDRMVETVAEHLGRIRDIYELSWSDSSNYIVQYLDKGNIECRCKQVGLFYPKSRFLNHLDEYSNVLSDLSFPVIAKPTRPLSAFKIKIFFSAEDFKSSCSFLQSSLPVILQEFVTGDDRQIFFGALYLDRGKVLARFEGRKLCSRPMGHTTIAVSEPNDLIHKMTHAFFYGLDISGPVSLELKKDPSNNYWVIEPTVGRTDFWLGLCDVNGVPLPLIEYHRMSHAPIPVSIQKSSVIWINGERHPTAIFWLLRNAPLLLLRNRLAGTYIAYDDIKPSIHSLIRWFNTLLRRILLKIIRLFCFTRNN